MQVILGYSSEWYPPLDLAARSEVNSGLFLSARLLPETKSSRDELFTFVYGDVGVYMCAQLMWMFRIWKARSARGRDRIRDNELRREKLDIAFVSYGLLNQSIFVLDLFSFKSRHFKLSILYISHVFKASIRWDSGCFIYMSVKRGDRDAESAPCTFSLFYRSTLFCCYYDYTQIKVDPFQFQTIPYSFFFFFFFFFGLSVAQITHVSTYAWLYYHHSQPFFFFFSFFFFN